VGKGREGRGEGKGRGREGKAREGREGGIPVLHFPHFELCSEEPWFNRLID